MPSQQPSSIRPRPSPSPQHGDEESSLERPPKSRRIRLACLRCQTRKIKCDGALPKCSNCHRANVECSDGKKTYQEGSISRSEAAALHDQIHRLEEIVRERCPDVVLDEVAGGQTTVRTERLRSDFPVGIPPPSRQPTREKTPSATLGGARVGSFGPSNNGNMASNIFSPDGVPLGNIPNQRTVANTSSSNVAQTEIAHEIGLIPLSSGVSKYVGPSSGFSFAKLVFARADQVSPGATSQDTTSHESPATTRSRALFRVESTAIPASIDQAIQLSQIYFEYVHVQYPFLHEPSHYRNLHEVYTNYEHASASVIFQVTMVLAISATILSKRLRIPFTGEGLCSKAMEYVNNVDFQNSTQGVQCLLLIAMFTLHSPHLGINPWYLNYQCLAAVLDLGLQRDVPTGPSVSVFDREMRTRIFWVIYIIDRTLATTLGRPIGLRDEACELRLPEVVDDVDLHTGLESRSTTMVCAIRLIKFALLNSEIKYILHSITRDVPRYTYPSIPDIAAWQSDLYQRLQEIMADMPIFAGEQDHLNKIIRIRYHEINMLLFRPTPRIRTPTRDSLVQCHKSAEATIQLWKELYGSDRMSYSWITIHSVCLSAITLLYCIWMVPETAAVTRVDVLTSSMRAASNILSAAGEHWAEARRSRNKLDDLTTATVRWLVDLRTNGENPLALPAQSGTTSRSSDPQQLRLSGAIATDQPQFDDMPNLDFPGVDTYINGEDLAGFVGAPDLFAADFSLTMEGMFTEYQPLFDFNPQQESATPFWGFS